MTPFKKDEYAQSVTKKAINIIGGKIVNRCSSKHSIETQIDGKKKPRGLRVEKMMVEPYKWK